MVRLPLSRRHFGRLAAAGLAGSLLGPRPRAAAAERCFLFLYNAGGWDPTYVFTPVGEGSICDVEADATTAEVNGIRFVDHAERPSVRAFFEGYGDRSCVVNGLEVRSVAHERCRQMLLTGSGAAGLADWPTRIATATGSALALPHLVIAGPVYPGSSGASVVRVGDDGQLVALADGSALTAADAGVAPPSETAATAQEAFLRGRLAAGSRDAGRDAFLSAYADALDRRTLLTELAGRLDLTLSDLGCERDIVGDAEAALDAFAIGATRTAMLRYDGWCAEGWDTHKEITQQSVNFEDLFAYLSGIVAAIDDRGLTDRVTLVVLSEMGRAPQLNAWGGKDHWTFTSCMLVGAGVRGGQVVGGIDDGASGVPIDLTTGEPGEVALVPDHLGATLLALADQDPGELGDPITAVLA